MPDRILPILGMEVLILGTAYIIACTADFAIRETIKHPFLAPIPVVAYGLYKVIKNTDMHLPSLDSIQNPRPLSGPDKVEKLASRTLMRGEDEKSYACIEKALADPITMAAMKDPVLVTCCGQTFEKSSIEESVDRYHRCPLCNVAITEEALVPNRTFKQLIEAMNN